MSHMVDETVFGSIGFGLEGAEEGLLGAHDLDSARGHLGQLRH